MKYVFSAIALAVVVIASPLLFAGPEPLPLGKESKAVVQPAPPPQCNWTGFYLGLNAGYGWGHAKLEELDDEDPGFSNDPDGFIGGGQVGYNFQFGSFLVVGVEGDFVGSDISESRHFLDPLEPSEESLDFHSDVDYIATIGGRIGVSFWNNHFLLFFKGGAAFLNFDNVLRENDEGEIETFNDEDDITTGFIGGGLEYALNCHWSIKAEYKHYLLEEDDNVTHRVSSTNDKTFHRNLDLDSIQFGINFRF